MAAEENLFATECDDCLTRLLMQPVSRYSVIFKFWNDSEPPKFGKTEDSVFLRRLRPLCRNRAGMLIQHSANLKTMGDTGLEPVTSRV
jgi:hypothetical protein